MERKGLNAVLGEALTKEAGVAEPSGRVYSDLDALVGAWRDDPRVRRGDPSPGSSRRIALKMMTAIDANRYVHFDHLPQIPGSETEHGS
jgi:hypothetical protein